VKVVEFALDDLPDLIYDKDFNASRPTAIYFHGWWGGSVPWEPSIIAMRNAYVGYNFIGVDWKFYSNDIRYFTKVIPQLKVLAETFAEKLHQLLDNGLNIELLHLSGHSLGGQTVGKVGRQLKKNSHGKYVIPMIIALDPAGPGFVGIHRPGFSQISKYDAKFVQIIHSSSYLGMTAECGTVDFYPNGGTHQPGCGILFIDNDICNHLRAWKLFQAALRSPKGFPAVQCASYDDFLHNGNCLQNEIAYMGVETSRNASGKYYLQTNGNMYKFSKGLDGIKPSTKISLNIDAEEYNSYESQSNEIW